MANNQNTFIQLPMDVANPWELRRFLDKLVQQLDIAFGNRGPGGFASSLSLVEVIQILNDHELRLDNIEGILPEILSDIQDLKAGELIVTATNDIVLGGVTETILCDCTSNNIEVTLPNPSTVFNSTRSKKISISKIDNSNNIVSILPFSSEIIVGDNSVDLFYNGEIINLITNGTNWYLGA